MLWLQLQVTPTSDGLVNYSSVSFIRFLIFSFQTLLPKLAPSWLFFAASSDAMTAARSSSSLGAAGEHQHPSMHLWLHQQKAAKSTFHKIYNKRIIYIYIHTHIYDMFKYFFLFRCRSVDFLSFQVLRHMSPSLLPWGVFLLAATTRYTRLKFSFWTLLRNLLGRCCT